FLFHYTFFFFQAEDVIRDFHVTGVQTCALPILPGRPIAGSCRRSHCVGERRRLVSGPDGIRPAGARQPLHPRRRPLAEDAVGNRSEERRVGKESRFHWMSVLLYSYCSLYV